MDHTMTANINMPESYTLKFLKTSDRKVNPTDRSQEKIPNRSTPTQKIEFPNIFLNSLSKAINNSTWVLSNSQSPRPPLGLKGQWTTSVSSPIIFFQKSWDFYTVRSVYLCSDRMLNLTCNFNLVTKIFNFFLQRPFLKNWKNRLLKMVASVMTAEFGTIHHYSSLEENSDAWLCNPLNRLEK